MAKVPDYWLSTPVVLPTTAGMHRVAWDLRYPDPVTLNYGYSGTALPYREYTLSWHAIPGKTPRTTLLGPMALPGNYTVKLTVNGQTFTQRYGAGNDRVWFRKFQNDHWKDFEGYNSPNNWRYIRYADVLLMYAEALNATGRTATAYQYVDRVRQRAGLATLSSVMPGMNQQQFLAQLKHERITELTGEGHRWNDLARWGDLGPGLVTRDAGFANFDIGKHELLPIPQQEIDINPDLEQNPDW